MTRRVCMAEQRIEDRKPAEGRIWFILDGPGSSKIRGRLLDYSKSGFRASHSEMALSAGQRVRFRHAFGQGSALVIWNRVLAEHVETGFFISGK